MMSQSERLRWPDPVLRIKDAMDLHALGGGSGYVAFKLTDGTPLTVSPQPSRAAARKYASRYTMDHLLILEIQPDGMPYREASAVLQYERTLISQGVRTPDSLESEANSGLLSMPRTTADRRRMAAQLRSGKPLVPDGRAYGNHPAFRKDSN